MLQFFRKYQKIFFFVVAFMVIVSFLFFGTVNMSPGGGETSAVLEEKEVISRILSTSPFDPHAPLFCNEGTLQKEWMASGMGLIVARAYFAEIRPELNQRLEQARIFRPYVHPRDPEISARAVWKNYAPRMLTEMARITNPATDGEPKVETLAQLFRLHMEQMRLPPVLLQRFLAFQLNQKGMEVDPSMSAERLSLFGFESIQDWFGQKWVDRVCEVTLRAATLARKQGYKISSSQVRQTLLSNIAKNYQKVFQGDPPSPQQCERLLIEEARHLGLSLSSFLEGWKTVFLSLRLFEEAGKSMFLDRLPFEQFSSFANESAQVELYELPSSLQFTESLALFRFQLYLQGTSEECSPSSLMLPQSTPSLEWVEKNAPELVERCCDVEYAMVHIDEVIAEISLSKTWEWEAHPQKSFPRELVKEGSWETLHSLSEVDRLRVDGWVREQIVRDDPQYISTALKRKELKAETLHFRNRGGKLPFAGLKKPLLLWQELVRSGGCEQYSADGKSFYRIVGFCPKGGPRVLSYEESERDGTLAQMLDEKLMAAYPEVRKKNPAKFRKEDGAFAPYAAVKELVGRHVFADLLDQIEAVYKAEYGELPTIEGMVLPASFYTQYRFLSFMRASQLAIREGKPLPARWSLEQRTCTLSRSSPYHFAKKELFLQPLQEWSGVQAEEKGNLLFYRVLGTAETLPFSSDGMQTAHKILAEDAKRDLLHELLLQK